MPLVSLEILGRTTLTEAGIEAVADQVENVFVRGLWCKKKEVVSEAVKVTRRLVCRCVEEEFEFGSARLWGMETVIQGFLRRAGGRNWQYKRRVIQEFLDGG